MLWGRGGGGGSLQWNQNFWMWPLPPPGPLSFVCEWPAAGIPLTRAQIDAQALIDASARAQEIFPNQPDDTLGWHSSSAVSQFVVPAKDPPAPPQ